MSGLAGGASSDSAAQDMDTDDSTAPGEVTSLSLSSGDGEGTLTWADPADTDFDHVTIAWTPADGIAQPVTVSAGVQTAAITGLTNGTAYTIVVKTVDGDGNTSAGASDSATPLASLYFDLNSDPSGESRWTATCDWERGVPVSSNVASQGGTWDRGTGIDAYDGGSPYGGERTIDTSGWVNVEADLGAYAGEPTVYFRWVLRNDFVVSYHGVFIDDIEITE